LLNSFDQFRRDVDSSDLVERLDSFKEQADMLTSKLLEALDIEKENSRCERYGKRRPKNQDDGGPKLMEHFLIAHPAKPAG
jgi:hypothetical protein